MLPLTARFGMGHAGQPARPEPGWCRTVRVVAGGMMVAGAGLNTVLVATKPDLYAALGPWFADLAPWDLGPVAGLWATTFGEHPRLFGAVVGVGYEATIGALALSRSPRLRVVGLGGIAAFKVGLLTLGLWSWAVPWLAALVPTIAVTAATARPTLAGAGASRERQAHRVQTVSAARS